MRTLTVIPVIDWKLAEQCIGSMTDPSRAFSEHPEDILVVDNAPESYKGALPPSIQYYRDPDNHNLGVARAWNIGARKVVEQNYDYLILMSQSMFFGPMKETTWIRQMTTFNGADVIESDGHSWHLIALHRRLFELVGYFDENFYPGYFEQIDWCYRLRVINREGAWPRVWVNALSQSVGKHSDLVLAPPLLDYYREKWGGDKGEETFNLPWGSEPLGYFPANTIPTLARKYKLEHWW